MTKEVREKYKEHALKEKRDNEKYLRDKYNVPENVSKILFKYAFEEGHAHGLTEIENYYTTYLDIFEELQDLDTVNI